MINLSKSSGPVSLSKGAQLRATVLWPSLTDYDLGAEVLYADGHSESIAMFGAPPLKRQPKTRDRLIVHRGDIGRSGGQMAEEVLDIVLTDAILAVVPWAYSAQSNGTGSFRRYSVSMEVTDGNEIVRIDAKNASAHETVYTCVPGYITNLPGEGPRVYYAELYSSPGSEHRPRVSWGSSEVRKGFRKVATPQGVIIEMDAGPRKSFK